MGRSAVRKLKAHGLIPAVIYGGNDKPQPLQVSARDINAMMSQASGENVLVELEIDGDGQSRTALVQEVQHSPVGGEIRHVDFHAISMDEMIQAEVPLEPIGHGRWREDFRRIARAELARISDRMSAGRFAGSDHGGRFAPEHRRFHSRPRHSSFQQGVTPKVQLDLTAFSVVAPVVEEEPSCSGSEAAAAGPEVITEKKEEGEAAAAPAPAGKEKASKDKEKEVIHFGFRFLDFRLPERV